MVIDPKRLIGLLVAAGLVLALLWIMLRIVFLLVILGLVLAISLGLLVYWWRHRRAQSVTT